MYYHRWVRVIACVSHVILTPLLKLVTCNSHVPQQRTSRGILMRAEFMILSSTEHNLLTFKQYPLWLSLQYQIEGNDQGVSIWLPEILALTQCPHTITRTNLWYFYEYALVHISQNFAVLNLIRLNYSIMIHNSN